MLVQVNCPNCLEKGKLPEQYLGSRIKCKSCGQSFVPKAEPASPEQPSKTDPATPAPVKARRPGDIEVEGLDEIAWTLTPEPSSEIPTVPPAAAAEQSDDPAFEPSPTPFVIQKSYKVLTSKDPWFKGKFELPLLEEALNHYASQGWVVRSMATPMVTGFSGPAKEELVVIMER